MQLTGSETWRDGMRRRVPAKEGRSVQKHGERGGTRLFDNAPRNLMVLYLHKVMHNICTYEYTSISGAAEGGKQLLVLTSCEV